MNRRSRRDAAAIAFARSQRATANESAHDVWQMVRNRRCRGQKFRREHPIPPYTVDFCCVALRLIVEVDGEHHQTDEGRQHDQRRDQYLSEQGYHVVRIPGYDVLRNTAALRQQIEQAVDERNAEQSPSSPGSQNEKRALVSTQVSGNRFHPPSGGSETSLRVSGEGTIGSLAQHAPAITPSPMPRSSASTLPQGGE